MKLLTIIFYMVAFTQLSFSVFFDFCLISLFCNSVYSYDLSLPEPNNNDISSSDPIVTIFYITKYLLHFICLFLHKQKKELIELTYDNDYHDDDDTYDVVKYLQYKCIQIIEFYNTADNYYTQVIVKQTVLFIQTSFIYLFKFIVSNFIAILSGKTLPTFNELQSNNSKDNINKLDIELVAELEYETETETDTDKSKKD